ncbi:hypothetical protein BDZ97DRAFT_1754159 [Flammula alnicola]|nr:hypothetical protein BDZ97DRAFT_1754159 [Flammula alnicola]
MTPEQEIDALSLAAAFISWLFLNRRTVRGDHAVAFYASIIGILNAQSYWSQSVFSVWRIFFIYFSSLSLITVIYRLSPFHPLAKYPGPVLWRVSSIILSLYSFTGKRHLFIEEFHKKYGPIVRIGPNALTVNSITAIPILYSTKYHMEKSESYNKPGHIGGVSLFFKHSREESTKRKKIWYNAFSGSA